MAVLLSSYAALTCVWWLKLFLLWGHHWRNPRRVGERCSGGWHQVHFWVVPSRGRLWVSKQNCLCFLLLVRTASTNLAPGAVTAQLLTLSLLRVIDVKFSCSLTRNITSHSMENLAFHSLLRWKMIIIQILATPLMHFLFKRRRRYFLSSGVSGTWWSFFLVSEIQ